MTIIVSGKSGGTASLIFNEDGTEIYCTKDQLTLIFTAISGLYGVGWMDGKHCQAVELTYSLADINKALADNPGKGRPEKELVDGAGYL